MINTLITSKTRIKLLLKFFLNPDNSAYLRGLESEFNESSNAIRLELNRLEEANMLNTEQVGNRKLFRVNQKHPLFGDIKNIVSKYFGLDVVIDHIIQKIGNLKTVYLTGDIAKGMDAKIIDLILVGTIDQPYLIELIEKAEKLIHRKVRYIIYSEKEFESVDVSNNGTYLLIWQK
ncbi:MAG: ArsR family transcriptional regulator [Cyclobacteriaceae bacterium]